MSITSKYKKRKNILDYFKIRVNDSPTTGVDVENNEMVTRLNVRVFNETFSDVEFD